MKDTDPPTVSLAHNAQSGREVEGAHGDVDMAD